MPRKRKLVVSCVTPLVITFLTVQSTFAATNVTLKKGMSGQTVTELQKDLKSIGFMNIDPTGYYGDVTQAAVSQFQRKYGLYADGIAGKQTFGKIDAIVGAKTSDSKSADENKADGADSKETASRGTESQNVSYTTVKLGMKGVAVTELQKGLRELGFLSVEPTGYFGSMTKTALIKFQKKYGLSADGVAGKQTFSKIASLVDVDKTAASTKAEASRGISSLTDSIIDFSKELLGIRYRWGGTTTRGFDCSGFTKYVYNHFGISIDRSSRAQAQNGAYVKKSDLMPGDLVFFDTNGGHNRINHVGMYIGGGRFINASSSNHGVTISDITSGFYADSYMTARRVLR